MTLIHGVGNDPEPKVEVSNPDPEGMMNYQWENFRRAIAGEKLEGEVTPGKIIHGLKIINAMAKAEKNGTTELV